MVTTLPGNIRLKLDQTLVQWRHWEVNPALPQPPVVVAVLGAKRVYPGNVFVLSWYIKPTVDCANIVVVTAIKNNKIILAESNLSIATAARFFSKGRINYRRTRCKRKAKI